MTPANPPPDRQPPGAHGGDPVDRQKQAAAAAAAELVEPGTTVGLGTGSTVGHLLPALAARAVPAVYVATSPATETAARQLGLDVRPFTDIAALDLAIDGADQVADDGWLVKGGGGAHTREKIVAVSARQFVVMVSSDKLTDRVRGPVPLEIFTFGAEATLARLAELGDVRRRPAPVTPDGGVLADLWLDDLDPPQLAARLDADPGVVAHGLFPPAMTWLVLIATEGGVRRREVTRRP
ncbi:MAG: ribose 5-phosphate isomerase A [Actinomycetota bacterium]|nr:ribose 5-phosphate isomerase A [Actinomycetota bacterium]